MSAPRDETRRLPVPRSDLTAEPTYEAECVEAATDECGAESGPCALPARVTEWIRRHYRETGHRRYLRISSDHVAIHEV